MIFISLGSQKFQMNRLLKAVDEKVENGAIRDEVFAQIGHSDYKPIYYEYTQFLTREEINNRLDKADIVISHGGTGIIVNSIKRSKKVIAVARLNKYGEHVDDHQIQIVSQFSQATLILACDDCSKIDMFIDKAKRHTFDTYTSNTETILKDLQTYIEE